MEAQSEGKEKEINSLKQKLTQQEMKSIKNESVLRDELELVKDKNNKLLKVEATLEIYKSRLAAIPELKAKLAQALRTNLEFESLQGDQMLMKEENERLQSCLKYCKEEQTKVNDASTKKDI